MAGGPDAGRPYFGPARIFGGAALFVLACVLMVFDAASQEYMVETVQLALILGTGSLLLGVEAFRRFGG